MVFLLGGLGSSLCSSLVYRTLPLEVLDHDVDVEKGRAARIVVE
jgi:hypothetical protein